MPNLCIQHDAGCLPVNSAMTRQNPQLAYTIRNQTSVIMPLRSGGFTMPVPFNKRPAKQTTVNRLNCDIDCTVTTLLHTTKPAILLILIKLHFSKS